MNMPEIESRYVEEIRVLRNEIRQYREKVREQERLLRERNDQLQRSLLKVNLINNKNQFRIMPVRKMKNESLDIYPQDRMSARFD